MQTNKVIITIVFSLFLFCVTAQKKINIDFTGCWVRKIANEKYIFSEDSTMTNIIYGNGEIKSVFLGTWQVVKDSLVINYNTSIVLWHKDKVYYRNHSIEHSELHKIKKFSNRNVHLELIEYDEKYKSKLKRQKNCNRDVIFPYKIIDVNVIITKFDKP